MEGKKKKKTQGRCAVGGAGRSAWVVPLRHAIMLPAIIIYCWCFLAEIRVWGWTWEGGGGDVGVRGEGV